MDQKAPLPFKNSKKPAWDRVNEQTYGLYNHIAHMIKHIKKLNFLEQIICMKSNISDVFLYDYHNYSLLLLLLLLLIYY